MLSVPVVERGLSVNALMAILAAPTPGLAVEPTLVSREFVAGEQSAGIRVEDLCVNVYQDIRETLTLAVFKGSVMKIQIVDLRGLVRTTSVWTHVLYLVVKELIVLYRIMLLFADVPEVQQEIHSEAVVVLVEKKFALLADRIQIVRLAKMTDLSVDANLHI